ncbi:hypothetical protein ACTGXY_07445 [Streptococcus suis]
MAVDVIHAWHGTTQKNAQQIRNQGFKKTTIDFNNTNLRNLNDLGEGIYCFVDSMYGNGKQMAARYAHSYRDSIAKKQGCSIEVIEVEAAVQSSMMLDLDDADTREIFIQFSKNMKWSGQRYNAVFETMEQIVEKITMGLWLNCSCVI